MMNKTSITNRKVIPLESFPAEALDHILEFGGGMGMGIATPMPGKSFHGVLHKVSGEHMKILDGFERGYARKSVKCKLYDGKIVDGTIYTDADGKFDRSADKPPSERYIDIMIAGCEMYGVKQSHIDWLRSIPHVARTRPDDFKKFDVPEDAPVWTIEELKAKPMHFAVNNKVIHRTFPVKTPAD